MRNVLLILALLPGTLFAQTPGYVFDALVYPKMPERIITVGGTDSDIQGYTNEAIQIAVDAPPSAGGTINLSAGKVGLT